MTNRFIPRAISFAMAAMMTFTMLASIDGLAFSEHAANGLMAQATVAIHAA